MATVKRGQTSVEYLGTYAWAFLGLIVTMGALSLFGVFEPETYIPESCESGSQIVCEDAYIGVDDADAQSELIIRLKNNYARNIEVIKVETAGDLNYGYGDINLVVTPGSTVDAHLVAENSPVSPGSKYNIPIVITYKREGGTAEYTVQGNLLAEAREEVIIGSGETMNGEQAFCGDREVNDENHPTTNLGEECDPPRDAMHGSSDCDNNYPCASDCTCQGYCGDGIYQPAAEECGEPGSPSCGGSTPNCYNCQCVPGLIEISG